MTIIHATPVRSAPANTSHPTQHELDARRLSRSPVVIDSEQAHRAAEVVSPPFRYAVECALLSLTRPGSQFANEVQASREFATTMAVTAEQLAESLGWLRNLCVLLECADDRIAIALKERPDFESIVAELSVPHGGAL